MLAHPPPLPLIIDYDDEHDVLTAEDEEAIVLALGHRYRVRLAMPVPNLQKLIVAMDEEYPVLEYLIVVPSRHDSPALMFPGTLQAPHLRHLTLLGFANPIGSRLFTAAVGLVTLCLIITHPHAYFQPDTLLQWILFIPQLEILTVYFVSPVPNRDMFQGLALTWKRLFVGSLLLASRRSKLSSSNKSCFPFHVSYSLQTRRRTSGSTVPSSSSLTITSI
jgi:hypothetical protein